MPIAINPKPVYPEELVASTILEGHQDAEMVGGFIQTFFAEQLAKSNKKPLRFPKRFLVYLAIGCRLLKYEHINCISDLGALPSGVHVIRLAFRSLHDPLLNPNELKERVYRLHTERFAWNAQTCLNADITISDFNEEIFLDTMADFLWSASN